MTEFDRVIQDMLYFWRDERKQPDNTSYSQRGEKDKHNPAACPVKQAKG